MIWSSTVLLNESEADEAISIPAFAQAKKNFRFFWKSVVDLNS